MPVGEGQAEHAQAANPAHDLIRQTWASLPHGCSHQERPCTLAPRNRHSQGQQAPTGSNTNNQSWLAGHPWPYSHTATAQRLPHAPAPPGTTQPVTSSATGASTAALPAWLRSTSRSAAAAPWRTCSHYIMKHDHSEWSTARSSGQWHLFLR